MEWPDLVGIQSLLDDIRASVEKFERTQNELARVDALEKSLKLSRALENPHDVVFKLFLSVCYAFLHVHCLRIKLNRTRQPN